VDRTSVNRTSPDPVRAVLEQVLTALGKDPGFGAGLPDEFLLEQITAAAEAQRRSEEAVYEDLNRVIRVAQDLIGRSETADRDRQAIYRGVGRHVLAQIWSAPGLLDTTRHPPHNPST
jgi:hypothetical protein